ncbi:MAG: DUF2147 domain-containing protein [Sphingomicrobium sp.]
MRLYLVSPALLLLLAGAQQPPASIEGRWRSPGGNSIIAVGPCGERLCGTVAWASAKAKADSRKATDQLVGTQLLTGLEQDKKGRWQGKLFIPDRNMRVTAKIQLVSPAQLKVSGCAAGKSLCRSSLWTRFDGPLPAAD